MVTHPRADILMAIPTYNSQGVLPPHNGDPADISGCSPYPATSLDLCTCFGQTSARRAILSGYLQLRAALHDLELTVGFQWIDGRFLEMDRGRRPEAEHIRVVTFYQPSPLLDDPQFAELKARVDDFQSSRSNFRVDHSFVNLDWPLTDLINQTRHYAGLLSHQSETGVWKGMLEISLNTPEIDAQALAHLVAQRLTGKEQS